MPTSARRALRGWLLAAIALSIAAAARAQTAALAMPDAHSARVAEQVLRAGGNAVDAAVAAAFMLAVTYPEGGNLGGGGFMLIHASGATQFLDYRETAPARAERTMFLDERGEVLERSSLVGHRASGVPGTVAGLFAAHRRYGTRPWRELVAPAAQRAREGFAVPRQMAERARAARTLYTGKTNFDEYFGEPALSSGALFRQPELAATLERIAAGGADELYRGETARLIVAEMRRGGGLVSRDDLERYRVVWREPLTAEWHGYTVATAPPPSSGGFAIVQLLRIKDYAREHFAGVAHNSAQYVHLIAEIEKRVFADRAEYLGDPAFSAVRIEELVADRYLARRAAEIAPRAISPLPTVRPGLEPHDTTHFSIVDGDGNAVANTYTLNTNFGSGVVVAGAGFLLNNEMDDFAIKPGAPNFYGVAGSTANEVQPGKRMLSSMSPTMLLRDGSVELVVGTPGGPTIFTTVFQAIVNVVEFGMPAGQAIGISRFHHQLSPPDLVTYSPAVPLPAQTLAELAERGYRTAPHGFELGDVQLIVREGARYRAASDPRGRGAALVVDLTPAVEVARARP